MTESPLDSRSNAPHALLRDVLVLVAAGLVLGIAYNAMQRSADATRALPWVRTERHMASLEASGTPPAPLGAGAAVAGTPAGDPGGAGPAGSTAGAATARDSSHAVSVPAKAAPAKAAPAGAAPGKPGKPAPAPGAPGTTPPPAAAAAPAASAPAVAAPDLPAIPDSREPIEIKLDVARRFHTAGAALFVDARTAEEFASGHIAGAVNLSFDDTFRNPGLVKGLDPKGRPIIVYCGGGDCELSRNLAFSLLEAGYHKVLVFTGGIQAWIAAGAPLHSGAQP